MADVVIDTNVFISGDKDLLVLNPYKDIPILAPTKFLKLLAKE